MNETKRVTGHRELLPAIIVAGLFWAFYTVYIDDIISSDLRLVSSILSAKILNVLSVSVERNGTVLFGNGMRFEVIGACSGSTILKVMLGAGIFLSLSWRGLSWPARIIAIALSALLAIFFNAFRVSLLVILSIHSGSPISEGFLHNIIGIATFILCFGSFCLICKFLHKLHISAKSQIRKTSVLDSLSQTAIMTLVLLLLYLPFIKDIVASWVGNNWDNSNRSGYIFFLAPLAIAACQTMRYTSRYRARITLDIYKKYLTSLLIIIALTLPVLSQLSDIKALAGAGIIFLVGAILHRHSDTKNFLLISPLLVLAVLGFPRIILRLENILPETFPLSAINFRILAFVVIISLEFLLRKLLLKRPPATAAEECRPQANSSVKSLTFYGAVFALTLCMALAKYTVNPQTSQTATDSTNLDLPYFLKGGWIGKDKFIASSDISYFGANNIIYREYSRVPDKITKNKPEDSDSIELLITFSGGDRHKNHPPEFCQSGNGWEVLSKTLTETAGEYSRPVTVLHLSKLESNTGKKEEKYMAYFFSAEGEFEETNFSKMMLGDITSRISGKTPNWLVVRVFCKSKEELLKFLQAIPSPLKFTTTRR